MRRQMLLAIAGAILGVSGLASMAAAALLTGPSLSPDHGAPGTVVHVTGFPDATSCPSVRMYISLVTGITSLADPRLHRLSGRVSYGLGPGQASTGGLTRVPLFRFTVPALRPDGYATYFTCPGSKTGWAALFEDAGFRVEPLAPGATMPPTSTELAVSPPPEAGAPSRWLLMGALSIAGAMIALRRGRPRSTDPVDAAGHDIG